MLKPWPVVAVAYLAVLATLALLDAAWISLVAADLFRKALGDLMRPTLMLLPAISFYPLYAIGVYVLAVRPALQARSLRIAVTHGALLGLVAFATFDLTNLAILVPWTYGLAAADNAWGVMASTGAAVAGFLAGNRSSRDG